MTKRIWAGLLALGMALTALAGPVSNFLLALLLLCGCAAPQKAPEGSPCAGCPYWREISCVFCYWKYFKEQS